MKAALCLFKPTSRVKGMSPGISTHSLEAIPRPCSSSCQARLDSEAPLGTLEKRGFRRHDDLERPSRTRFSCGRQDNDGLGPERSLDPLPLWRQGFTAGFPHV